MKNPRIVPLIILTILAAGFTIGLFVGRNYCGQPMTLSIPEEIRLPSPTPNPISQEQDANSQEVFFPININTASAVELTALPGIGDGLASQIVAYREANGNFSHVEQLMNVPGIGENRLEAVLSLITVGG